MARSDGQGMGENVIERDGTEASNAGDEQLSEEAEGRRAGRMGHKREGMGLHVAFQPKRGTESGTDSAKVPARRLWGECVNSLAHLCTYPMKRRMCGCSLSCTGTGLLGPGEARSQASLAGSQARLACACVRACAFKCLEGGLAVGAHQGQIELLLYPAERGRRA